MRRLRTILKWLLGFMIGLLLLFGLYYLLSGFKGEKTYATLYSDIEMEALLLKPEGPGPHPAILLLHGSGGSHQTYDKLYFKFHANAFLKKGFAVLVYTKRGSGNNEVDYDNFTFEQLMDDARVALRFVREQKDIDQDKVGLMGLSESGWLTPELAYTDGNIRFIINRVSSPLNYTNTVIHEVRSDAKAEGFTQAEIEDHIVPLTLRIWQFYIDVYQNPALADSAERDSINLLLKKANNDERLSKWFTFDGMSDYDPLRYASRGQRYGYDPLPFIKKIDCPMLYVMGEEDTNMPTAEIVGFLEKFRREEQKDIDIKVYEGATHYLYRYGLGDGPYEGWLYHEGYLDLLSNWALEKVNE